MHLELGSTRFDITTRALVMATLHRSPESSFDDLLRQADTLVREGADLLDVGGAKAGQRREVTVAEELERVVPAIEALSARFDLPISVDTARASVLEESLNAGACTGNDISGFSDPAFLGVAARHGASVVATHGRRGPPVPDPAPNFTNVRSEVTDFLRVRAEWAQAAGIPDERIMVDAGLDLGKPPSMSLELLRHSDDLVDLGFPVLVSAFNEGFVGDVAGTGVDDRREASWGAHTLGIALGCRILRAHDTGGTRRVADTMSAILQQRQD